MSALQSELEEAAVLAKEVEAKLKAASARKQQIERSNLARLSEKNQQKVRTSSLYLTQYLVSSGIAQSICTISQAEKVSQMLNKQEMQEIQQYGVIEKKIATANAKRQDKLAEIQRKSSSKKHFASPKPSPTKNEIEARINEAARRREMFLLTKIDKATASSSSKKLSPRADLFANTTPRLEISSPRIKAARVDDTLNDSKAHYDGGFNQQHFTMIAATSIALAMIAASFSYWRH